MVPTWRRLIRTNATLQETHSGSPWSMRGLSPPKSGSKAQTYSVVSRPMRQKEHHNLGWQICIYLVIGISSVMLDALIYGFLFGLSLFSVQFSKFISVVCSVAYSYVLNCRWTFAKAVTPGNVFRYCTVYGVSIIQNVATNAYLVKKIPPDCYPLVMAFLCATVVSVCINFMGMKLWVFRER